MNPTWNPCWATCCPTWDPCWGHGSNMGPMLDHMGPTWDPCGTHVGPHGSPGSHVGPGPPPKETGNFFQGLYPWKMTLKNKKIAKKIRKKILYIFIVESFQYLFSRASFEYFHFPSKILVLSKNSNFAQMFWFLPEQNFCPNGLTKPRKSLSADFLGEPMRIRGGQSATRTK